MNLSIMNGFKRFPDILVTFNSSLRISSIILLSVFWSHNAQSGLTDAELLVMGEKHIYLFGDTHNAGTSEKISQQVDEFVAALEATKADRNEPMRVLWEKANDKFRRSCDEHGIKRLLVHLPEMVQQARLKDSIQIEDSEIRKVAASAMHLLGDIFDFKKIGTFEEEMALRPGSPPVFVTLDEERYFDEGPRLKDITFQDVTDSYLRWLRIVQGFRKKHEADPFFQVFDDEMNKSLIEYKRYVSFLAEAGVDHPETTLMYDYSCAHLYPEYMRSAFESTIGSMFCYLMNMHLFQQVYEHSGRHIAIVAGEAHTAAVASMLRAMSTKKIQAIVCMREALETGEFHKMALLTRDELIAILKGYSFSNTFRKAIEYCAVRVLYGALYVVLYVRGALPSEDDPEGKKPSSC